ncbi:hypothetical protein MXB_3967 [Myxobolus squamalis]|nr:hypothetical protein MXB_3967 [Myxobolus squamalis]
MSKVTKELRLKKSVVDLIVKTFQMIGRIEKSIVRKYRSKKITAESGQFITTIIEFNSSITLDYIKHYLFTLKQCDVSVTTISSYLKKLMITLKRTNLVLERVNDAKKLETRKVFVKDFLSLTAIDDSNYFFIFNEYRFYLHLKRNYRRSVSENCVFVEVQAVRGRIMTLLSEMNGNSIVY